MGKETEIIWTESSWNPWQGCTKTSPGCTNCYMYATKHRYGQDPSVVVRSARATFTGPLRWKTPRKVFTCSWSDFFHQGGDEWRAEAWDIIRATTQHSYQILTKRPERIAQCLPSDWGAGWSHVWLGVTVENADYLGRIDLLRQIPAQVRFLSLEPLLGPMPNLDLTGIRWVIVGGESGPHFRPCDPAWVRGVREQCVAARVPFFFKQWGGRTPKAGGRELDGEIWNQFPGMD